MVSCKVVLNIIFLNLLLQCLISGHWDSLFSKIFTWGCAKWVHPPQLPNCAGRAPRAPIQPFKHLACLITYLIRAIWFLLSPLLFDLLCRHNTPFFCVPMTTMSISTLTIISWPNLDNMVWITSCIIYMHISIFNRWSLS